LDSHLIAQPGGNISTFLLLQACTKQGAMPPAVLAEAKRHAARLIELMPDNPGSYEIMSYVMMHDAEQSLEDARRLATTIFSRCSTLLSPSQEHIWKI